MKHARTLVRPYGWYAYTIQGSNYLALASSPDQIEDYYQDHTHKPQHIQPAEPGLALSVAAFSTHPHNPVTDILDLLETITDQLRTMANHSEIDHKAPLIFPKVMRRKTGQTMVHLDVAECAGLAEDIQNSLN